MFRIFMDFSTKEVKHFPTCLVVWWVYACVCENACVCLGGRVLVSFAYFTAFTLFPVLFVGWGVFVFVFCVYFPSIFVYSDLRHQKSYAGMKSDLCHKMLSWGASLVQCELDSR